MRTLEASKDYVMEFFKYFEKLLDKKFLLSDHSF